MTDPEKNAAQKRLADIQKILAERAAKSPKVTSTPVTSKKAAKPKEMKVLSQAAQKRLAQEALEASKTKKEKLAESVASKGKAAAKHTAVQRNLDAINNKKPKAPNLQVRPVPKLAGKDSGKGDTGFDLIIAKDEERERRHHVLLNQASGIRTRIQKIAVRERVKLAEALRDCYAIYEDIETGMEPWKFYEVLRSYFKAKRERIQENTPEESLLVRYVFDNKSNKQVSEYATVLRYALDNKIAKKDFVEWYTKITQTKILALARNTNTVDSRERMSRAYRLLMRFFDMREEKPLGYMEYPEHLAAKQVHLPDDLILVVCRGIRRFDRGAQYDPNDPSKKQIPQVEIRALHFIPPNIDFSHDIINRLARYIAPNIERFEQEEVEAVSTWLNDLTNHLTDLELGAAYKANDKWADRMQAAIAEDQVAFVAQRKKIQKLRNKSRG